MTGIFLLSGQNTTAITSANTRYMALGSTSALIIATEANLQTTWRTGGTFSNLYCNVTTNTAASDSTLNYRIGAGNGNQTIVITGSTTGEFSDVTHTDSVSAGNQVNYQIIEGSTGSLVASNTGIQFAPTTTTNTVNKLGCNGSLVDTSALATYYNPLAGVLSLNTTEANAQFTNKLAATLQNLYVYISANTASVATLTSRIGGGAGNLTVSIGSGVTGILEDTTHTDSITSGNLVNTAFNSTVTTTVTITNIAVDYLTTTNKTHYIAGIGTGISLTPSLTRYHAIAGNFVSTANSEITAQSKTGIAFTASNLEAFAITNTLTANATVKFRKATANGNQILTYGSGVAGYLEDTTHTDSVTASNEIDYQIISGGTGTSIVFGNVGILADYTVPSGTLIPFPWMLTTGNMQDMTGGMRN